MQVIKRNGQKEAIRYDRISDRITELSQGLEVDSAYVIKLIINGIVDGIKTSEIDTLCAETCASLSTYTPDYDVLATRMFVSNLHKMTNGRYRDTLKLLMENKDRKGVLYPLLDQDMVDFALKHITKLEEALVYDRDYSYSYFGLKTLERSYLLKLSSGKIIERPQHMLMRVALGMYYPRKEEYLKDPNLDEEKYLTKILRVYEYMSKKYYTHASPTLFNCGTNKPQLSSCLLLNVPDDIDGISERLGDCMKLSKYSAGLGINISDVRSTGSLIRGTNGDSNGVIPMLKCFDSITKYINQGGKRNGSLAVYIEPWHPDIFDFLKLRKNDGGPEEMRCKNIFLALWLPDLFMRRVKEKGIWSLFCPDTVKGLTSHYGKEFDDIYLQAEIEKKYTSQVKAEDLWRAILESQMETSLPYLLSKDSINMKSNHKNIGCIKGSNLCTEITEYTDPHEIAVCNLASISLPAFIKDNKFDFNFLGEIVVQIVQNLNRVIDYGFLPVETARKTNLKQRALGIGVQGLQDVFFMLKLPFDSKEASVLNKQIFETMYYYGWQESARMVSEDKLEHYSYFEGSPISQGILQCDMWNVKPITNYDWGGLRKVVQKGVRNSLLFAPMPTAATSSILGNTESIECISSNICLRKVLAGEFIVLNKYLVRDLKNIDLWNKKIADEIIANDGSIQNIEEIPKDIKLLYRTVWEIKQKILIDLQRDRSPFICQSTSLNLSLEKPSIGALTSMHFYSWEQGLKTLSYYMRSKPASKAPVVGGIGMNEKKVEKNKKVVCTDEICVSCTS